MLHMVHASSHLPLVCASILPNSGLSPPFGSMHERMNAVASFMHWCIPLCWRIDWPNPGSLPSLDRCILLAHRFCQAPAERLRLGIDAFCFAARPSGTPAFERLDRRILPAHGFTQARAWLSAYGSMREERKKPHGPMPTEPPSRATYDEKPQLSVHAFVYKSATDGRWLDISFVLTNNSVRNIVEAESSHAPRTAHYSAFC